MRAWFVIALVWLAPFSAASAQPVAVVVAGPQDVEVAEHLVVLEDVTRRELTLDGDIPHAWLPAAATLDEALVVVIRRSDSAVHVLRPRDGTVLTRQMDEGLSRESAVAVALVAAELVGVARQLFQTSATPLPPDERTPRPSLPSPEPEEREKATPRGSIGGAFGLGLAFSASPGRDVSLVTGEAFGELHAFRGGPVWLAVGAALSTPGTFGRDLGGPNMERVEYRRFDLALRVGIGFGTDETHALLSLVAGVSWVDVHALAPSGERLGEDSSARGTLGLMLSLRQRLWRGLFIAGNLGGAVVPEPTRYLMRGALVLVEGDLRLSASLNVGWEL